MTKSAFFALTVLMLGGCASIGPLSVAGSGRFDAVEAAPIEPDFYSPRRVMASSLLQNRAFSMPSQRRPDMRLILVTAVDRRSAWRKRRAVRRRTLLTS